MQNFRFANDLQEPVKFINQSLIVCVCVLVYVSPIYIYIFGVVVILLVSFWDFVCFVLASEKTRNFLTDINLGNHHIYSKNTYNEVLMSYMCDVHLT